MEHVPSERTRPFPRLYYAAPLSRPGLRRWNLAIVVLLEARYSVYLPQRDGGLLVELLGKGLDRSHVVQQVFERDVDELRSADLLFAAFPFPRVDEGVAFEIGYVTASAKPTVAYVPKERDMTSVFSNPMIAGSCCDVLVGPTALTNWLAACVSSGCSTARDVNDHADRGEALK